MQYKIQNGPPPKATRAYRDTLNLMETIRAMRVGQWFIVPEDIQPATLNAYVFRCGGKSRYRTFKTKDGRRIVLCHSDNQGTMNGSSEANLGNKPRPRGRPRKGGRGEQPFSASV